MKLNEVNMDKEVNNFTVNRVFLKIYYQRFNLCSYNMTLLMSYFVVIKSLFRLQHAISGRLRQ